MRCPFAVMLKRDQVAETRDSDEGDAVRRRRRCQSCDKRFTTERADITCRPSSRRTVGAPISTPAKLRASMHWRCASAR